METKKFSTLYVGSLTINNLHALVKTTTAMALSVEPAPLGDMVNAALVHMQTTSNALGDQLNKGTMNPLTTTVRGMSNDRKARWGEIKSYIDIHKKGRDAAKKAAATALYLFFKPYLKLDKAALNTATDQIEDLLTKFNVNKDLAAHAQLTGIDTLLAELGTVNTAFDVLYQQRNLEKAAKTTPSASNLKLAVVKSYTQFCAVLEYAVSLNPNDTLSKLFNTTDELRKKYAQLASKPNEKKVKKAVEIPADKATISAN